MTNHIRPLQAALSARGYYRGRVDGLWGPMTQAAVIEAARAGDLVPREGGQVSSNPLHLAPPVAAPVDPPSIFQGSARYPVREVIVHCSATRPDWMATDGLAAQVAEIRRWHKGEPLNWRDIGYHWIIGRAGNILPGRPETEIGAGVENRNRGVIHICLIGGHGSAETDAPDRHFTAAQLATLRSQIEAIRARTTISSIAGHNQFAAKACPGFNVPRWWASA